MAKKTAKKKVAKKKATKKATGRSTTPVERIQEYAHEIWLAGLGAFALAQEEGGKLTEKAYQQGGKVLNEGSKLFDRLVKEGAKLENKGRKFAGDTVGEVKSDVESRVNKVRETARTSWDKLEKVFEDRVARALSRLGVPTSDEIQELSKRVAELNARVREMDKARGSRSPASKASSKKSS